MQSHKAAVIFAPVLVNYRLCIMCYYTSRSGLDHTRCLPACYRLGPGATHII